ncbi:MAG: cytochrome c maturation protein CcmE [Methanosarcinaceae archaeon]|nr:cytochrome c maturation protein CcmE [Methanosarcinaceae archaeon]
MDKKQKTLVAIGVIVAVSVIGLWGVDVSQGYLMVSELKSNPQEHIGQQVNTMGSIKDGTLLITPDIISFILTDAEDKSIEIEVEYTGNLPANLDEGKNVTLGGTMVSGNKIEANKIVIGCSSKYTE